MFPKLLIFKLSAYYVYQNIFAQSLETGPISEDICTGYQNEKHCINQFARLIIEFGCCKQLEH